VSDPLWGDLVAFYEAEGRSDSQARLYHPADWIHQRLRRLILQQLRAHTSKTCAMLDAGCAEGIYMHALIGGVRIAVGLDISLPKLARAHSRSRPGAGLSFAMANLERIPLASGSFDVVLCVETLEHVPDHGAAIAELHRVLMPGGIFIVSVPTEKNELRGSYKQQLQWHEKSGHLHSFSREELGHLLEAAGFSICRRIWVDMLGGRVRHAIVSGALWRTARAARKPGAICQRRPAGDRPMEVQDSRQPMTSAWWQRLDSWLTRLPGLRRWGSLGIWVCTRQRT